MDKLDEFVASYDGDVGRALLAFAGRFGITPSYFDRYGIDSYLTQHRAEELTDEEWERLKEHSDDPEKRYILVLPDLETRFINERLHAAGIERHEI
ncbi:hypothetical protein [Streptomyces sp. NPDC017448]|uniref:hypothetical protein n=1 Tax=Streptomyces sp. NPDC017448 TaxID=3364996 RepID=UPI0037ADCF2A